MRSGDVRPTAVQIELPGSGVAPKIDRLRLIEDADGWADLSAFATGGDELVLVQGEDGWLEPVAATGQNRTVAARIAQPRGGYGYAYGAVPPPILTLEAGAMTFSRPTIGTWVGLAPVVIVDNTLEAGAPTFSRTSSATFLGSP